MSEEMSKVDLLYRLQVTSLASFHICFHVNWKK